MIKEYLQLTRAHTLPLETVPAAVGALLATGGNVTYAVLAWTLFGACYHLAGYGMNSLTDWLEGYDVNDPNKQHHPLNTGAITGRQAYIVCIVLFLLTLIVALYLSSSVASYVAVAIMVVSGVSYNVIGKRIKYFKFVPISIAHSMVFALPFISLGGNIHSIYFIFAYLTVFMWVAFQIGISGEVKDLGQEESNLVQDLSTDEQGIVNSSISDIKVRLIALGMRVIMTLFAEIAIFSMINLTSLTWYMSFVFVLILLYGSDDLIADMFSTDDRMKRISYMAQIEVVSMIVFLSVTMIVISFVEALIILILSALWVLIFNRYLWGTWMAPRV